MPDLNSLCITESACFRNVYRVDLVYGIKDDIPTTSTTKRKAETVIMLIFMLVGISLRFEMDSSQSRAQDLLFGARS